MDRRTIVFVISLSAALFLVQTYFTNQNAKKQEEWVKQQGVEQETPQISTPYSPSTAYADDKQQDDAQGEYFLLENDLMQLVFSSKGGSLVEINLPFKGEQSPDSAVRPIEFDRNIESMSPQNARFPLFNAKLADGSTKEPSVGGYYPLLRRDILSKDGKTVRSQIDPKYYGLNIVSEYPEVAKMTYRVKSFTNTEIVFVGEGKHRRITKRFTLPENARNNPYCLNLDVTIEGDTRGLYLTSGVPDVEWQSGGIGSTIKYRIRRGQKFDVEKIDLPKDVFSLTSVAPEWISNSNGFFGIIIDPMKSAETGFKAEFVPGDKDLSRLTLIDSEYNRFPPQDLPGYNVLIPLKTQGTLKFRLFAGPFADNVLDQVDTAFAAEDNGISPDFIACQTFHGWFAFISEPFAKFLWFLMKIAHDITGSWAFSIILATLMLRVVLYPLNNWSMRSMKNMQALSPQIKAIQEKYKKEPQKAQLEIVALYREKGVNPISGCFPLLLQMPFLIGMFDLLKSAFELRGAPFIPGWIDDLSAPDVLFSWSQPLPFIGNQFHFLPILLGAVMYWQQTTSATMSKNPADWTEQQRQQRFMANIMTVVLTVMFYNFPSGLNIYWISSMLFGALQQWYVNRTIDKKSQDGVVTVEVPSTKTGPKKRLK